MEDIHEHRKLYADTTIYHIYDNCIVGDIIDRLRNFHILGDANADTLRNTILTYGVQWSRYEVALDARLARRIAKTNKAYWQQREAYREDAAEFVKGLSDYETVALGPAIREVRLNRLFGIAKKGRSVPASTIDVKG